MSKFRKLPHSHLSPIRSIFSFHWRRAQVVKGRVCKTLIQQFESARRLQFHFGFSIVDCGSIECGVRSVEENNQIPAANRQLLTPDNQIALPASLERIWLLSQPADFSSFDIVNTAKYG